ncbi:MAG: PDZ domain-containing protein [candidate division Zixibacteria bacterium]|nr:PDZ domain-containing protein [candidate division Zixibacteria bacterium]
MLKKSVIAIVLATFLASLVSVNFASAKKSEEKTKKGWLGVYIRDITKDIKEAMDLESKRGVLIGDVVEDSPAFEAGIKREDVILTFDGKKVNDPDELIRLVRNTSPGDKVKLLIIRNGKEKNISVILGKVPKDELHVLEYFPEHKKFKTYSYGFSAFSGGRIGVKVQDINEQLGEYFGVKDGEGALITEVDEEGPAYEAGLRAGDVIVEVDGEKIDDVDELMDEISDKDEGDKVKIKVIRDHKPKNFTVEVGDTEEWSSVYLKGLKKLNILTEKFREPKIFWEEEEFREHKEELREELEELKEELEELREELKDLKKELR